MADKDKKVAQDSKVEKATTDESKAAAKVAKAAKGNKKTDKPNIFVRAGKTTKRFFKDFKGECKKIVWPDAKTVLKSTGIVLLVVTIVCLVVFAIDQTLSLGVKGLKNLAAPQETTAVVETTAATNKQETTKAADENKETTKKTDEESAKETTQAAKTEDKNDKE